MNRTVIVLFFMHFECDGPSLRAQSPMTTPLCTTWTVIFIWTPPHFWALAIKYRDEYSAADVPMLPSVVSTRETAVRMLYYAVVMIVLSVAFSPVADMGPIYLVSAIMLGLVFLVCFVIVLC